MDDETETLVVDVRAGTAGFKADVDGIRNALDTTLVDGFARAGTVLERGLASAIRRGSLGFEDLRRTALATLNDIAAQSLKMGLDSLFGRSGPATGGGGTLGSLLNGVVASALDLPGRATGGPVSPGAAYVVGERGPEVFVPTSAGRIETGIGAAPRDVRVAITLAAPRGSDAPVALQRSARQVASSVRRALGGK